MGNVAVLADLLHETADHHGSYEAVAPPHDWWDWYAAYMDAREGGRIEVAGPVRSQDEGKGPFTSLGPSGAGSVRITRHNRHCRATPAKPR